MKEFLGSGSGEARGTYKAPATPAQATYAVPGTLSGGRRHDPIHDLNRQYQPHSAGSDYGLGQTPPVQPNYSLDSPPAFPQRFSPVAMEHSNRNTINNGGYVSMNNNITINAGRADAKEVGRRLNEELGTLMNANLIRYATSRTNG